MNDDDEKTTAEKLVIVEQEHARLRAEYEAFRQTLRDPGIAPWLDGQEDRPQRVLTQMEVAAIKHINKLAPQINKLARAEAFLIVRTLDETAGRPSDGGVEDPEALLRASLVCLSRAWKDGHRHTENRVLLKALANYLTSLDDEIEEIGE